MIKTTLIPIYRTLLADLDTPVSVYLKLARSNSFLLESVTGGEQIARYSFIGIDPFLEVKSDGKIHQVRLENQVTEHTGNLIELMRKLTYSYQLPTDIQLPYFSGGAVGYFSWESIQFIEKVALGTKKSDLPVAHFLFPRTLVIFDHVKRTLQLLTLVTEDDTTSGQARLDTIETALKTPLPNTPLAFTQQSPGSLFDNVTTNMTQDEFMRSVEIGKQHIFEGDVFQLVVSQKFQIKSQKKPFDVYRTLRYVNPSPYMFFMDFGNYQVVGSSPETMVKLIDGVASLHPIAGTRKRSANPAEEKRLEADLLSDEKEKSEHIMLVDLGRNDLGRVCEYGSVKTTELMRIEKYSHVMHMVSDIEGKVCPEKDAFDVFSATFPAGTLSGAPKVRAIEIIDELEKDPRRLYGAALGYFDFRGNMDLCIVIRTAVVQNGVYSIQAGAGIVADSVPKLEYEESRNKASGMIQAIL